MWQYLKTTDKPIVLYGMGDGADKVLDHMEHLGIPAAGVFASDAFVRGQSFRNFPVTTYDRALEQFGDMIVLVCFGSHLPEVMERICQLEREQELYVPDMPVVGHTIFDQEFCEAHRLQLEAAYALLADEPSRDTFRSLIAYKLTGKLAPLLACQSPQEEAFANLLRLKSGEHFLDLGAYNGDTVQQFCQLVPDYGSITAVEPDPYSFRKLQRQAAALPRCRLVPAAIAAVPGQIPFCAKRGRGSAGQKGQSLIPCDSVDHLVQNSPVTYLKMDVEGLEAEALHGAAQTLRRLQPKLLISAYHRAEDLFSLPLLIHNLQPNYRIYLRRHPCIPAWDVNYYCIPT